MGAATRVHLPGLDGLRAVAVAAVVAYHLGFLGGGFIGVDLFFVLSGFLITSLLLDRPPGSGPELRAWWGRRIRRLTPAVAVVVVAVLVVFGLVGAASGSLDVDAIATLTWWQNWHLIVADAPYWGNDPSPLRHAWSLSIEEQFYVVWPIVCLASVHVARRRGRSARQVVGIVAAVGTAASFLWAQWLLADGAELSRIYFGSDARAGALLLGCAAAAIVDGRRTPRLGRRSVVLAVVAGAVLVALVVGLDVASTATYLWGLPLAAAGALALVLTASFDGPVARALGVAPLRWLGVRSYALYLWSWPVQVLVEQQRPDAGRTLVAAVTIPCSLVLADLSMRLVERPLRADVGWARRLRPRVAAWSAGVVAVAASIVFVGTTTEDPTGVQALSTEESAEMAFRPPPSTATSSTTTATSTPPSAGATTPPPPTTTTAPPPPPRLRLMVTGDSVAFSAAFVSGPKQLHPAGIEVADGRGLIGCWLLSRDDWRAEWGDGSLRTPVQLCREQGDAERIGLSVQPDWVVHFAGGWEGTTFVDPDGVRHEPQSPAVRAAVLAELIERGNEANAAGSRMAWVAWACPGAESYLWFAPGYAGWFNQILREASAAVPGSIVIEPTERVCVGGDADAAPTAEKDRAWGHEHHPYDGAWLWQVWLGPALWAAPPAP